MSEQRDLAEPDFLRLDGPAGRESRGDRNASWMGWPSPNGVQPKTMADDQGRVVRVRTPAMDLPGLTTPTRLFYVVQHFTPPEPVPTEAWTLRVSGLTAQPLEFDYEALMQVPARTVRTVLECSGSDAGFYGYLKGEGPRPARDADGMIVSAGEFTGAPLAAVLERAGIRPEATHVMVEGRDRGLPSNATPGLDSFLYAKALPLQKALHPDTILAWAMNGELLEHLHGAPARLVVPGWSGNWSVKWVRRIELLDHEPDLWYHYHFYYYGDSADDPKKELVTTVGVKSIVTFPRDDGAPLAQGKRVIRGYAWSGAGAIARVAVSTDGGATWQEAHVEFPRDRWMWVRWSLPWEPPGPGRYQILSRAVDEAGNIQPLEPRYNYMRKNFNAVVATDIRVEGHP